MATMYRDFLNPIMKTVPLTTRPRGYVGGLLVALIAAINPISYFTRPYFGAIVWLIMAWWFYNVNPLGLIRPRNPERKTLFAGNPLWYQFFKSLLWGFIFTPIPMFVLYYLLLVFARTLSKVRTS